MKRLRLTIVALFAPVCLYAAVVGTSTNDILFFQGNVQTVSANLFNPYSFARVGINGSFNVNIETYDGLGGIDTLLLTNDGDYLTVDANGSPSLVSVERVIAGDGDDVVNLASTSLLLPAILIDAGRGNDVIWSNAGDDTINGFDDNDIIDGGPGNDTLNGQNGDDTVSGGAGNDSINGGIGSNELFGDSGDDLFQATLGSVNLVNGGSGIDTVNYLPAQPRATFTITPLGPRQFRIFKAGVVDDHLIDVEIAQFSDQTVTLATLADDDLDGIVNDSDNCPGVANANQLDT